MTSWAGGGMSGSLLAITLAASVGLLAGKMRIRGAGFGVAGVLLAGILLSRLGFSALPDVLEFGQQFGLIFFVYAVGLQAGPGFVESFKRRGLALNLLATGTVFVGSLLTLLLPWAGVPRATALGLYSGATTNTPSYGAALQVLKLSPHFTPQAGRFLDVGYALAYPFGVLGVMLAYSALKFFFRGLPGSVLDARPAVEFAAASARESCEEESGAPIVLSLFIGILAGVLLGSIPLPVPGLPAPIRLGPAGGPIIAAIFLGRVRRLGPFDFTLSRGANALLREIGITLFMACVGLKAGEGFFDVLVDGPGIRWIAWGAFLTLVPTLLVGAAARRALGLDSASVGGLLAGSSTNPPALSFAADREKSEEPSIAYATVYPLTMILRILTAQVMALFFFR